MYVYTLSVFYACRMWFSSLCSLYVCRAVYAPIELVAHLDSSQHHAPASRPRFEDVMTSLSELVAARNIPLLGVCSYLVFFSVSV